MEWLNEPASWQRTGDVLTVSVDPGTDFWRETGYGYVRDSGHVYGEVLDGDLDVSVRVRCTLGVQYDQAGVMLRADERTWLKTGMEFFERPPRRRRGGPLRSRGRPGRTCRPGLPAAWPRGARRGHGCRAGGPGVPGDLPRPAHHRAGLVRAGGRRHHVA